jgi:hypothetical protein
MGYRGQAEIDPRFLMTALSIYRQTEGPHLPEGHIRLQYVRQRPRTAHWCAARKSPAHDASRSQAARLTIRMT